MKLLSIFHRNHIKNIPAVSKRDALLVEATQTFNLTTAQIKSGLSNPIASTGTPISDLRGGAKLNARISNIGGGSKASGGGGIEAGLKAILLHTRADQHLKTESQNKTSKRFLIK